MVLTDCVVVYRIGGLVDHWYDHSEDTKLYNLLYIFILGIRRQLTGCGLSYLKSKF